MSENATPATGNDAVTSLRTLLSLPWETLIYDPGDGWADWPDASSWDFVRLVTNMEERSRVDGWDDCAESARELIGVPRRRLALEWDGDTADGHILSYPDLRSTLQAALEEIERLRAPAAPSEIDPRERAVCETDPHVKAVQDAWDMLSGADLGPTSGQSIAVWAKALEIFTAEQIGLAALDHLRRCSAKVTVASLFGRCMRLDASSP